MTMYLIMRCDELGDQYECDANRTPICLVENWEMWYDENKPDYRFEVYEVIDNTVGDIVKDYEIPIEKGMALYYWSDEILELYDDNVPTPVVVKKWENRTRHDLIPDEVKEQMNCEDVYEFEDWLRGGGVINWRHKKEDDKLWFYGEYYDDSYSTNW